MQTRSSKRKAGESVDDTAVTVFHPSIRTYMIDQRKRLRSEIRQKEGQGNGDFVELKAFPIFWAHGASYEKEARHHDYEACEAMLVQSKATGRNHVVAGASAFGTLVEQDQVHKALADARKMVADLESVIQQISNE